MTLALIIALAMALSVASAAAAYAVRKHNEAWCANKIAGSYGAKIANIKTDRAESVTFPDGAVTVYVGSLPVRCFAPADSADLAEAQWCAARADELTAMLNEALDLK